MLWFSPVDSFGSPVDYSEWTCMIQASVNVLGNGLKTQGQEEPAHVKGTQPGKSTLEGNGTAPQLRSISSGSRSLLTIWLWDESSVWAHISSQLKRPVHLLILCIILLPIQILQMMVDCSDSQTWMVQSHGPGQKPSSATSQKHDLSLDGSTPLSRAIVKSKYDS